MGARTCDQLKPELRLYEDNARVLRGGGDVGGTVGGGAFGLCSQNFDCMPQRCDKTTNTCAACQTDADCAAEEGVISSPQRCKDGECAGVECLKDDDCLGGDKCNSMTHECATCITDADCAGQPFPHCSSAKNSCVMCAKDAGCTGQFTHCGLMPPFDAICVECNVDADCVALGKVTCTNGIGICR